MSKQVVPVHPMVVYDRNCGGLGVNPAQYLAKVGAGATDVRKQISAVAHMPYPADPLLEPDFVGLTYYQVALMKQAAFMAAGGMVPLEFFSDRMIGRPAQVTLNVDATESYTAFLDKIAKEEGAIDVAAENDLGI